MKDLDILKDDHKVEIVEEEQQKKEAKLIGRQRRVPGLILWEYNNLTQEVCKAEFVKQDIAIASIPLKNAAIDATISNRVNIKEQCVYVQALNYKNAVKRLAKLGLFVRGERVLVANK